MSLPEAMLPRNLWQSCDPLWTAQIELIKHHICGKTFSPLILKCLERVTDQFDAPQLRKPNVDLLYMANNPTNFKVKHSHKKFKCNN